MKLSEVYAGDMVVVCVDRMLQWLLVGNLLGPKTRKGYEKDVQAVIVHDLDPETLCEPHGIYPRIVSPALEVVAIVARGITLRAMRVRWFHRASRPDVGVTAYDEGEEIDPMMGRPRSTNPWR